MFRENRIYDRRHLSPPQVRTFPITYPICFSISFTFRFSSYYLHYQMIHSCHTSTLPHPSTSFHLFPCYILVPSLKLYIPTTHRYQFLCTRSALSLISTSSSLTRIRIFLTISTFLHLSLIAFHYQHVFPQSNRSLRPHRPS